MVIRMFEDRSEADKKRIYARWKKIYRVSDLSGEEAEWMEEMESRYGGRESGISISKSAAKKNKVKYVKGKEKPKRVSNNFHGGLRSGLKDVGSALLGFRRFAQEFTAPPPTMKPKAANKGRSQRFNVLTGRWE